MDGRTWMESRILGSTREKCFLCRRGRGAGNFVEAIPAHNVRGLVPGIAAAALVFVFQHDPFPGEKRRAHAAG